MATVPHLDPTVQFDTALRGLAAQAAARYAGETARIDRGLVIALNGGVSLKADGVALVSSQRDDEVFYIVRDGHCDCPDHDRAPGGRCKHRFAVCLVKRAQAQVAAERAAQTYYATYTTPDNLVLQGTAQWIPAEHGWLFIDAATDHAYLTKRVHALVLGGRVDILEAQRTADGNLVARICGY